MGLTDFIGKKYKLATSEKFDEYMKALGKNKFYVTNLSVMALKDNVQSSTVVFLKRNRNIGRPF